MSYVLELSMHFNLTRVFQLRDIISLF